MRIPFWSEETGEPLTAGKLNVQVNARPATVSRLLNGNDALFLFVVLDVSGDLTLVDPAREALLDEIGKLPPQVHVALLRAQDGLKVLAGPDEPRSQVSEQIRGLAVSGRAGLFDSIEPVQLLADSVAAKARVRVAVLLISDSNIANYREDYTNPVVNSSDSGDMSRRFPEGLIQEKIKKIQASVLARETPLFLVHLNFLSDRLNAAYQTGLLDLAASSGGDAAFCRTPAEIPESIGRMIRFTLSLASVEVEWQPGKARQLQIDLAAEGRNLRFQQRRQWKGRGSP